MKAKILCAVFILLGIALNAGAEIKNTANVQISKAIDEFVTSAPFTLKNENGWQIDVPTGWRITPVGGEDVLTHPVISMSLILGVRDAKGIGDVPENAMSGSISPGESSPTAINLRISKLMTSGGYEGEFGTTKVTFKHGTYSGVVNFNTKIGDKTGKIASVSWEVFGLCNRKGLRLYLSATMPIKDLVRPLKNQKIPPQLQSLFETLKCD